MTSDHTPASASEHQDLVAIIEKIAQQWDGCEYEAVGETIDIGDAIRRAGLPLALSSPGSQVDAGEIVLAPYTLERLKAVRLRLGMADKGEEWMYASFNTAILAMLQRVDLLIDAAASPKGTSGSDALDGWQPIETAPKDGNEFLAIWGHQGNVVQVVKWNYLHKFWQSKGEPIAGFATNATSWHPLPSAPAISSKERS